MIVGNTGAGKTVSIQSMLGYEHQIKRKNVQKVILLKGKLRKGHEDLVASDSHESVTRKMHKYEFELGGKKCYLIDSPGFSDTGGPIIEIINQINLSRINQNVDKICYIYLLQMSQCQSATNEVPLPKLAKSLAERFTYKTYDELKGMLLILFNNKNNLQNYIIENIIYKSLQLYGQENSKNSKHLLD